MATEDAQRTANASGLVPFRTARLAALVHDIRNPLNILSMNVELLEVTVAEGDGKAVDEGLDALGRAVAELEGRLGELDSFIRELGDA